MTYRQPALGPGPRCGTNDGMNDHNREGTFPCRDCEDARAIYQRQWRRRTMLGLPLGGDMSGPPRWVETYGDMAQAGAVFRAGVVMGA